MKRIALLLVAGSLAACSQEPATDATATDAAPAVASDALVHNAELDQKVMAALESCKTIQPACGEGTPAGYFVFPDITSVALGIGGAGGEGALVQNGEIVDYYRMGEGSVVLQAGITAASYVFEVRSAQDMEGYQTNGEWSIGASAGVTVATADANAQGQAGDEGAILYVFNSEGLMGDASVNAMKIWRTDEDNGTATAAPTT